MPKAPNRVTISRKDAMAPTVLQLETGRQHVVTLLDSRVQFIEFDDVFFSFNSTALLPETKDHTPPLNEEGEPITGLNLCMAVLQYSAQYEGQKSLLILGHTDTVGSDAENVTLSQLRAQVVYGLVAGDRQAFEDAVDAPHIADKETKANRLIPDKNFILDWIADYTDWPCSLAENHNDHWAATKQLQVHYNEHGHEFGGSGEQLDVDRDFGRQTWGAVFDLYQDHIARTLELSHQELAARQAGLTWAAAQTKHTGCGEFHPLDQIGRDGIRSATNRRVEVTFFDPSEIPPLECFAGGCAERACELFDPTIIARKPLPISWKAVWKVGWDRPGDPARMGEPRDMILRAPKLADGSLVRFDVELEVQGKRVLVGSIEAVAENEGARASFVAWYQPDHVTWSEVTLGINEDFPAVSFHVNASAAEREVAGRRPLIYADTLQTQVQHGLVQAEFDAEWVDPGECLIWSPWGAKRAEIDEDGLLTVERLPPGGVMVTIDDDPYYAV
ncbi:hypothetical protein [Enhygromyxa salina]|uniref:Uncharacterized protein n=1 Tax=Enhygromyxa salina TaxID=215803 RepID=A0A2S9YM70_9BACT|nr:hypothetical protein [Enhygromyxa salina]PRQ06193.1 hypothetical protein ENSA7_41110 [Enhygromyxa salina]